MSYDHAYGLSKSDVNRLNGKKRYYVCNEHGEILNSKPFWNKHPAGAARKAFKNREIDRVVVVDVDTGKPIHYYGGSEYIPARERTPHQRRYGMTQRSWAKRVPIEFIEEAFPYLSETFFADY